MACIVWRLPSGETYDIGEGVAHTPQQGAYNTGVVKYDCKPTGRDEVEQMLEKHGLKLGDAVAKVTKWLGIRECTPCAARRKILNNARELGWAETIRQLKDA